MGFWCNIMTSSKLNVSNRSLCFNNWVKWFAFPLGFFFFFQSFHSSIVSNAVILPSLCLNNSSEEDCDLMASSISFENKIWKSDKFKEWVNLIIFSSWVQFSLIWNNLARPITLLVCYLVKQFKCILVGFFKFLPLGLWNSFQKHHPLTYYTKMNYVSLDLVERSRILQ